MGSRVTFFTLAVQAAAVLSGSTAMAQGRAAVPDTVARAIFAELVGINTTHEHGNTTPAAEAVARRLLAAGFPAADVAVVGPEERNRNLVARLRGRGKGRPILLLAHLDVVEARPEDWSLDPFTLTERDGFFYGRGTSDIKDMAAIFAATLIRLQREGVVPDRDIILALTAGEESGADNGVQWLLAERRDLIDAEYSINGDGGDPLAQDGRVFSRPVQASEKIYVDVTLEVTNPGGHSSLPVPDNAITHLAAALVRVGAHRFPAHLSEITRAYFQRTAPIQPIAVGNDLRAAAQDPPDSGAVARLTALSPYFNAQLRTTCVPTRVDAGHANNALPQRARAVVNCRVLPEEHPDDVVTALQGVVGDTAVHLSILLPPLLSPPSPLRPDVMRTLERVSGDFWPGVPVIPSMETGATDGAYLRAAGMPVYGISGVVLDADDVRAHGRDERIRVAAFDTGAEFSYRLVRALAGGR